MEIESDNGIGFFRALLIAVPVSLAIYAGLYGLLRLGLWVSK